MQDCGSEKAPRGAGSSGRLIEEGGRFYIEPRTSACLENLRLLSTARVAVSVTRAGRCSTNREPLVAPIPDISVSGG